MRDCGGYDVWLTGEQEGYLEGELQARVAVGVGPFRSVRIALECYGTFLRVPRDGLNK